MKRIALAILFVLVLALPASAQCQLGWRLRAWHQSRVDRGVAWVLTPADAVRMAMVQVAVDSACVQTACSPAAPVFDSTTIPNAPVAMESTAAIYVVRGPVWQSRRAVPVYTAYPRPIYGRPGRYFVRSWFFHWNTP